LLLWGLEGGLEAEEGAGVTTACLASSVACCSSVVALCVCLLECLEELLCLRWPLDSKLKLLNQDSKPWPCRLLDLPGDRSPVCVCV